VAPGRPAVAVLLAAALLAGCGEPYEPIAEADRDPARVAAVEALGTGILQAWARDEYPPVEHAIAEFRAGWTEDRQRAADEQFEAELGDFVAMQFDHAERQASSGIEAYDFRATFDGTSQEQVVRVVVDADGRLAGFWIRPAASGSTERPSPSVPLVLASVAQVGVLAAGPAALVWTARKRLGAPLRLAAVGAIAFVASQLVHLPLNFALGILGPPRAVGLMPLPVIGVVAGLTAGLCEESARYVAMRWVLRRDRGWAAAVQYGLGHGGIEAGIVGWLAAVGLLGMLTISSPLDLGIPEGDLAIVYDAARSYWATPAYLPLVAVWERVCAMTFHVAASVLVMRSVVEGRVRWLLLAIAAHTALNAPLVYAQQMGLPALYALLTAEALLCAVFLVVTGRRAA
jgi:uncharacterized membrane protein YhfC